MIDCFLQRVAASRVQCDLCQQTLRAFLSSHPSRVAEVLWNLVEPVRSPSLLDDLKAPLLGKVCGRTDDDVCFDIIRVLERVKESLGRRDSRMWVALPERVGLDVAVDQSRRESRLLRRIG